MLQEKYLEFMYSRDFLATIANPYRSFFPVNIDSYWFMTVEFLSSESEEISHPNGHNFHLLISGCYSLV